MLPVVRALQESKTLDPVVVSTGQHSDMVREVLAFGGVEADVDLEAATVGSLKDLVAVVMTRFESFLHERFGKDGRVRALDSDDVFDRGFPAGVLVHGDTSSATASALSAFHMRIPVGHVEARLRTGSILTPFPEELNRQVISRIAAFHLAPTPQNEDNLIREGVSIQKIFVTGNTGIDTLVLATRHEPEFTDERIARAVKGDRRMILVTAPRRENWGGGLARIGDGIARIARSNPDVDIIVIAHPNPVAKAEITAPLAGLENVILAGAQEYVEFAHLQAEAVFAISDSGGVQEGAPALGTPVLVTHDSTERGEGVTAGTLRLVGTNPDTIERAAEELLTDPQALAAMAFAENPYGDGRAAGRIVAALEHLAGTAVAPVPFGSGFNRTAMLQAGGYPGNTAVEAPESDRTQAQPLIAKVPS